MARQSLAFLALGAAALVMVFWTADLNATWLHVRQIGWAFLIVLGLYGLEFLFNTISWQFTFAAPVAGARTLYHLWRIQMVGEAFNVVLAHVGGELVKAALLRKRHNVPYGESATAMVLSRTVLVISLLPFLLAGLALLLNRSGIPDSFRAAAYTGLVVLAAALAVLVVAQWLRFASRGIRLLFGTRAQRIVQAVSRFEEQLFTYYRTRRWRLVAAFLFASANWLTGVVTLYYTFYFLGQPISLGEAWIIETFIQLARIASFFIPAHLGAQEGAMVAITGVLTGNPAAGLAASVVRRARELIWVLWGLAIGWNDRNVWKTLRPGDDGAIPQATPRQEI